MSTADELSKLAELRDRGVLSQQEFNAQKARLLNTQAPAGAGVAPPVPAGQGPCPAPWVQAAAPGGYPVPVTVGNGYSTAGIILGAIAFLFVPILLGPTGLVLGAIGKSKGESKAVVAMVVSACGLVVGMLLGIIAFGTVV